MEFTNVATKHARIRTGAAWMARANTTVATHHHPGLAIESSYVRVFHRMADDAGATVSHDLHVKINRTDPFTPAYLFHVLKLVIRMGRTTDNRDIRWSTNIRQPARDVHRIVMAATRKD